MAVVLVTGVSSGFGATIREEFQTRGHSVIGTRRSEAGPGELILDVTDGVQRREVIDQVIAEHGRIDILINNAGMLASGSVEDTDLSLMRAVFETNYFGAVGMMQEVLPHMRRERSGRIVNITAIGAVLCTPFLATYGATKHALDGLSVALDEEVRGFGVRVTTVLPGAFKTEIMQKSPVVVDTSSYAQAASDYRKGLSARIEAAGADLSAVAGLVVDAATTPDPLARYVIASNTMMALLRPAVDTLEELRGPITQPSSGAGSN